MNAEVNDNLVTLTNMVDHLQVRHVNHELGFLATTCHPAVADALFRMVTDIRPELVENIQVIIASPWMPAAFGRNMVDAVKHLTNKLMDMHLEDREKVQTYSRQTRFEDVGTFFTNDNLKKFGNPEIIYTDFRSFYNALKYGALPPVKDDVVSETFNTDEVRSLSDERGVPTNVSYRYDKKCVIEGKGPGIEMRGISEACFDEICAFVSNQHIKSEAYKLKKDVSPFLQGQDRREGWIMIEFWTRDEKAMNKYAEAIHSIYEKHHP